MSVALTNQGNTSLESGAARAQDNVTIKRTHRKEEGTANLAVQMILRGVKRVVMGECLTSASTILLSGTAKRHVRESVSALLAHVCYSLCDFSVICCCHLLLFMSAALSMVYAYECEC